MSALIGVPQVHYRLTDSTNKRAAQLAVNGAAHGTVVTADEQTDGRGRHGRRWHSPGGSGLLFSLLLRGQIDDPLLALRAALGVSTALPVECQIKWPNDILWEGRKLAGVLIEGRPLEQWAVVGVGINVSSTAFPDELGETATSLSLAGFETTPRTLYGALVNALEKWLDETSEAVLEAWRTQDALNGRSVSWDGGTGTAVGIDEHGALVVETDSGRQTLAAGEVQLLNLGTRPS